MQIKHLVSVQFHHFHKLAILPMIVEGALIKQCNKVMAEFPFPPAPKFSK